MQNYDKKELKNAIYQHIKKNKYSSISDLRNALNFKDDLLAMSLLDELRKERFINQVPFAISETNDSSVRYIVTDKKYDYK